MVSTKTQVLPRLKVHLLKGKTITALEALNKFGTMRVAEFIRVLRHDHGLNIQTDFEIKNGKRYARYSLRKKIK